MHWRKLWPYAHNWTGNVVATLSGLLVVYGFAKAVIEILKWLRGKVDFQVWEVLESHVQTVSGGLAGKRRLAMPVEIKTIVEKTGFSEKKIQRSLQRLKRKKEAKEFGQTWKAYE